MRFLHVADTHVGHSALSRLDDRGLNQREQDFFAAFSRVVDLALRERVDFVLHAGDLFDSVRPTNRAVTFVMEECARSVAGGVPWLVLAGNHESPRLRETGSVLRFLDFVPGVRAAYRGVAETWHVSPGGVVATDAPDGPSTAVHLLPHMPDAHALAEAAETVVFSDRARWNVLGMHAGVHGVDRFESGEFNDLVVPQSALRPDADHVALGHYHRHLRVAPNAWFAGSTERTSVREAHEEKGVLLVDLASGARDFVPIETRRWIDPPPLDCAALAEIEVAPAVERALADAVHEADGALVRLRVRNLPRHVAATLDRARLRSLGERALHVALDLELVDADDRRASDGSSIGPLPSEWDAFVAEAPMSDRDAVAARGRRILEEAAR